MIIDNMRTIWLLLLLFFTVEIEAELVTCDFDDGTYTRITAQNAMLSAANGELTMAISEANQSWLARLFLQVNADVSNSPVLSFRYKMGSFAPGKEAGIAITLKIDGIYNVNTDPGTWRITTNLNASTGDWQNFEVDLAPLVESWETTNGTTHGYIQEVKIVIGTNVPYSGNVVFDYINLGQGTVSVPDYPYWPNYRHLNLSDLDTIQAQRWIHQNHVISGWDWSLPDFVEPSDRALVGLQRNFDWNKLFESIDLKFKSNAVGLLWVDWRDIEPVMNQYNFQPIMDRIRQANSVGSDIILRILCHAKLRDSDISKGSAPLWLGDLGVNFLPQEDPGDNLNFDPSHPEFHKRYLMLVDELRKSGIPNMVKAAYVGYASPSLGDEGIGPYGEKNSAANDTVQHVRERLDAWQNAFQGMESKIFMGGSCEYGFKKGFGVRRGFVEMYLYNIPNYDLGSYIDSKGYLAMDEEAPIMKYQCFNGEVNEEYEEAWATAARDYRFGLTTESFAYRYFTSNLRALQMRCTYIHTTGHLVPKMLPFISLELGRNVHDAPDVWTFLRTSYINATYYENNDFTERIQTATEKAEGIETKNFERWLYQRDATGYETEPAIKIPHAIQMWMVQSGKYYDYIARSGRKIGFNIDDRWKYAADSLAVKVTYFDNDQGEMKLCYNGGEAAHSQLLLGDSTLKTATFLVNGIQQNSMANGFDFTLEAGDNTERIVVSMVRVVDVHPGSTEVSDTAALIPNISVYPVPFSNFIQVVFGKNEAFDIYNLNGVKIFTCDTNLPDGSEMRIDTNSWPVGIYILKGASGQSVKIVKR